MKQTEYFNLNQWELTDRIRMEDFNADNARIEAALAELKAKVDELERRKFRQYRFHQADGPRNFLSYPITDVDWAQFSRVHFVLDVYTTAACTLRPYVYTNRSPDSFQVPASDTPRRTQVHITLFPGRRPDDIAWATIACEDHCVTRVFDFPFRNITTAGVEVGDFRILAGSSVTIYTEG